MKTITFYQDNNINKPINVSINKIIEDFYKTNQSKLDAPFDRLILNHLMTYGSYDILDDQVWDELYNENENFIKK